MELKPLKVKELNSYISKLLSNDALLYNINVEGEVSNCKYHTNGHVYFSLKDDRSKVRCIMFVNNAMALDFKIEDGSKITVSGAVSVYEKDGSYQVNVRKAKQSGRGELYARFEKLKEKLFLEGLFDETRKKLLPLYPQKIGIVSSITGATVRDMIVNIKRRNPSVDVVVRSTLVQGSGSRDSIVKSIEILSSRDDIDIIIVGRGGGSVEELSSFNEEEVARAIHASKVPIISAVGHETDFTIADFVADVRASTPSVAAEISVASIVEVESRLEKLYHRIVKAESHRINIERERLKRVKDGLLSKSPIRQIEDSKNHIDVVLENLNWSIKRTLDKKTSSLSELAVRLDDLSPLSTLDRGYTLAKDKNDKLIGSASKVKEGQVIKIQFRDGEVTSRVESLSVREE